MQGAKTATTEMWDQVKWDAADKDAEGKVSAVLFNSHVVDIDTSGDGQVSTEELAGTTGFAQAKEELAKADNSGGGQARAEELATQDLARSDDVAAVPGIGHGRRHFNRRSDCSSS
jgi:hypothetical protein